MMGISKELSNASYRGKKNQFLPCLIQCWPSKEQLLDSGVLPPPTFTQADRIAVG